MYCTVSLPYGEDENAILIPDASTATDQLGRYIYVVDDNNIVSYRHIEVGEIINDSLIHVKSGLNPDNLKIPEYIHFLFVCFLPLPQEKE